MAVDHFGREVQRGPGNLRVGDAGIVRDLDARPEVAEHDPAAGVPQDVLRLDVPVQQAGGVHRAKRGTHVRANPHRFFSRQRSATRDLAGQRLAADVLGPDADPPLDAFRPVHDHHVGVADAREQPPFFNHR